MTHIEPARLAALVDGRLSAREREVLLDEISRSPDAIEALGQLAMLTRDAEEAASSRSMPEPSRRVQPVFSSPLVESPRAERPRKSRLWFAGGVGIAAAFALLVGAPVLKARFAADTPASIATQLDERAVRGALPPLESNTARGSSRPTNGGAALLYGAHAIRLQLVSETDSAMFREEVAAIVGLLDGIPGSGPSVRRYSDLVSHGTMRVSARELSSAWEIASVLVGKDAAATGAWVEAARIAALRDHRDFFDEAHVARLRTALSNDVPGSEALIDLLNAPSIDLPRVGATIDSLFLRLDTTA